LKIPKGGNQNPYIKEEQITQWSKEKVRTDKQRSTKHTHKTKDRITRTQLKTIRYSKTCGSYQDFLDRGLMLTKKLPNQGFLLVKLKSSLRKFYGRHHDLVDRYGIFVSQITTDIFHLS
jgi:hypothetical protein